MSNGHGASGGKTLIVVGTRVYETTAVPIGQKVQGSVANALVASGAATPQQATYAAQFPWTMPSQK